MIVDKLGPIEYGEIKIAPLTILCGANNQGKTYFSYTLYGILKYLPSLIKGYLTNKEYKTFSESGEISFNKEEFSTKIIDSILRNFKVEKDKILEVLFNAEPNTFEETNIDISSQEISTFLCLESIGSHSIKVANTEIILEALDDKYTILASSNQLGKVISNKRMRTFIDSLISDAIMNNIDAFYIPAERIGINVFKGQLNSNKIEMLDIINNVLSYDMKDSKPEANDEIIKGLKKISTLYPKPIEDYLRYINGISNYKIDDKNNEIAAFIRRKIIKGRFVTERNSDKSYYRLQVSKSRYKTEKIPLHITSSSIKSIYGLDYYFENIDDGKENTLIIDEPEMSLHPSSQVEIANLLDLAISKGIKILISTHSDFLVRKIQNIILKNYLSGNTKGLSPENVKVYNFQDSSIYKIDLLDECETFNNFNDTVEYIENEYQHLIDKKEEKDY